MPEETFNIVKFSDELENFVEKLKDFEDYFKSHDSLLNNEINKKDINSLNSDLANLKENLDETNKFLLSEFDSSLEKQQSIQIDNDDKFNELLDFLKKQIDKVSENPI